MESSVSILSVWMQIITLSYPQFFGVLSFCQVSVCLTGQERVGVRDMAMDRESVGTEIWRIEIRRITTTRVIFIEHVRF